MLDLDDFRVLGSLLLAAAYLVAAYRGDRGEDEEGRYRRGLKFLAVAIFLMLVAPENFGLFEQTRQLVAIQMVLSVAMGIVSALCWLASFRLLCLYLMERK